MNESDYIFTAKYVLGRISSKDILGYVDRKLTEGSYLDSYLYIIDAEFKTMPVLGPLLEAAIKEAGMTIPSFNEAVWIMLKYHINLMASGSVDAQKQFSILLYDIEVFDLHKGIKKYVGDNIGISLLYGLYYDDCSSDAEINKNLIEESKNWVNLYDQ